MQLTGNDANIKAFDTTDTDFQTTSSEKKVVTVLLGLGVVSLLVATFFDKNVTNLVMNQN